MNFIYSLSVTAGVPKSLRGHLYPSSMGDFGGFVAFGEHKIFRVLKFIDIVILWVYYTIPFGLTLFFSLFGITSHLCNYFVWQRITDGGGGVSTRNAHMVHIAN